MYAPSATFRYQPKGRLPLRLLDHQQKPARGLNANLVLPLRHKRKLQQVRTSLTQNPW